jgi:hypothetical protein
MHVKPFAVAALIIGIVLGGASSSAFASQCDQPMLDSLSSVQHIVWSLRSDKPGQLRVFSADGREFTAAQARWLQSQVREIDNACNEGRPDRAVRGLMEVQQLIDQHR